MDMSAQAVIAPEGALAASAMERRGVMLETAIGGIRPGGKPGDMYLRYVSASYPLNRPPTFSAAATMRAERASISASARVFSRGCSTTSMAIDLWPSGTPAPW